MASLSTCHLGLWLGWQILLNLVKNHIQNWFFRRISFGINVEMWGAMAYWLEGRTLNRENQVSNPTAVVSNLWQV